MTINEAQVKIEKELKRCSSLFAGSNVNVKYDIHSSLNETPTGTETLCLFGVIELSCEGVADDDKLLMSLDTDIKTDGSVDADSLEDRSAILYNKLGLIKERLDAASDKAEELRLISKEVDDSLDEEYKRRLEALNANTRKTLITAAIGAAVLLVIGAICIIIGNIM